MSRIADRHGLTNRYRSVGTGKRAVRRGNPRVRLVAKSKRRRKTTLTASEAKVVAAVLLIIAGVGLCVFAPIFIPVVLGAVVMGVGDAILKKIWNLQKGRWSAPASVNWTILTAFEMMFSFFYGIFVAMGETSCVALVISVVVYAALSILIIVRKQEKIKKRKQDKLLCTGVDISGRIREVDVAEYKKGPRCYMEHGGFEIDDVSMIDGMDGHDFEYFCADVLKKNGFSDVSVTRGSGDQGVDILATKHGISYAIQCKNYITPLGNKPIQEVSAGKMFYNCDVGVVLTNSTFTPGAVSLAEATGVLLWGRSILSRLIENTGATICRHETVRDAQTYRFEDDEEEIDLLDDSGADFSLSCEQQKWFRIDSIDVGVDTASFIRFGIQLVNFGIEIDEDDYDQIELLFDVVSPNGRTLPCDIDIVCNVYAGDRKIKTSREMVCEDRFFDRDSVCVYLDRKNIGIIATRIELFCQRC